MEKSLFKQLGGTYTEQGDYRFPNLVLPPQITQDYGIWDYRRLCFLKEQHKLFCYNLLIDRKLCEHLVDVDRQAQELYLKLIEELKISGNITEELKAKKQIEWVHKMSNILERAKEIVDEEIIFNIS